jgi:hypothetical protein
MGPIGSSWICPGCEGDAGVQDVVQLELNPVLISFFPAFLVAHSERINHFLIGMPFDFAVFTVFMASCRLTTKDQKYVT